MRPRQIKESSKFKSFEFQVSGFGFVQGSRFKICGSGIRDWESGIGNREVGVGDERFGIACCPLSILSIVSISSIKIPGADKRWVCP
jgi:hypothetical protein